MILTGVPYQHKHTKRLFTPDDVTADAVYLRAFLGDKRIVVSKESFTKLFERFRETLPPKGWDEEL